MAKRPNPVIVIPGIMGSALRDEYPLSPETVWSPFRAVIKAYDRITLHPDDPRYELKGPARVVKDQVFELFYQEFIEELRHNLTSRVDEPVPVFPFAYDWRQPLVTIQQQLGVFIKEVIGRTSILPHYHADTPSYSESTGKVSLVGHSMGGLIIAGYLAQEGFGKIDKVASIASPFRGSLEAVAKVAIGAGAIGLSPSSTREREAARVTPALYHLLPSFVGAVDVAPGLEADLFKPSAWQLGVIETLSEFVRLYGLKKGADDYARAAILFKELLDTARSHRQSMESLVLDDSKRWLCIVGVGAETRIGMSIHRSDNDEPTFVIGKEIDSWKPGRHKRETGDGTVPLAGAIPSFIPPRQIVCLSPKEFGFFELGDRLLAQAGFHSSLPSMNMVHRMVVAHLSGIPQRDVGGYPLPGVSKSQWDPPFKIQA